MNMIGCGEKGRMIFRCSCLLPGYVPYACPSLSTEEKASYRLCQALYVGTVGNWAAHQMHMFPSSQDEKRIYHRLLHTSA